jgi:hypothetical protein
MATGRAALGVDGDMVLDVSQSLAVAEACATEGAWRRPFIRGRRGHAEVAGYVPDADSSGLSGQAGAVGGAWPQFSGNGHRFTLQLHDDGWEGTGDAPKVVVAATTVPAGMTLVWALARFCIVLKPCII